MANLNELTVSLLDRLAKECGIKFRKDTKKTEKIATIENAGIEETYLEQLLNKYLAQKSFSRKTSKDAISELKGRVKYLFRSCSRCVTSIPAFSMVAIFSVFLVPFLSLIPHSLANRSNREMVKSFKLAI